MYYVIDVTRKFTTHEGSEDSCRTYISNVIWMNVGRKREDFVIVKGAKNRDIYLKDLRRANHPSVR